MTYDVNSQPITPTVWEIDPPAASNLVDITDYSDAALEALVSTGGPTEARIAAAEAVMALERSEG